MEDDTSFIRGRIAHNFHAVSVDLSESKIKIDSTRAVLQLLADHIERGAEIDAALLTALIHTVDIGLAEASDAVCNACCQEVLP
jgi:hypothetical protein